MTDPAITRIKLPGTSLNVRIRNNPTQPKFTTLQPIHELLFSIFFIELQTKYNDFQKSLENKAKLKEALENNSIIELRISTLNMPFEYSHIINAVNDFVSMGVTLWGKGWWGCYNLFLHASLPSNYNNNPTIKISVAIRVARRLLKSQ